MKRNAILFVCATAALFESLVVAQSPLNQQPSRIIGQARLDLPPKTANPNGVDARGLFNPWYITIDKSSTPSPLYVSDAFNSRVLAWKDAAGFTNGQPADLQIGQLDFFSSARLGPNTPRTTGLSIPGALATDANGNLYVADTSNNRILRYPKPFGSTDDPKLPDMVIGQTSFNANVANSGGVSETTLQTAGTDGTLANTGMVFDSQGNLFFSDPYNHRVLRYPAAVLAAGKSAPAADLVIGQPNFTSNTPADTTKRLDKTAMRFPAGLAFDPTGRLYVTDALSRVLVYLPPLANGIPAARIMGIPAQNGLPNQPVTTESTLATPEGIIFIGNNPVVFDSAENRVVRYDAFENWPAETPTIPPPPVGTSVIISPPGKFEFGQQDFSGNRPNGGKGQPSTGSLSNPQSAVYFNNELYIADSGNNRVIVVPAPATLGAFGLGATRVLGQDVFDSGAPNLLEGKELFVFNSFGTTANFGGDFSDGAGVAIDTVSNPPHLYVSDTFNNRILAWNDARRARQGDAADLVLGQADFQHATPNYPTGNQGQLNDQGLVHPAGIGVDAQSNLFVADSGNARVVRFPNPFANYHAGTASRADLVLGQHSFFTRITDPSASSMAFPYGIAFTLNGSLLVSDPGDNRVLFFRKDANTDFQNGAAAVLVVGQPDFNTTSRSSGPNRLINPRGIATDSDDRLYVVDGGTSRVLIYDRINAAPNDPSPAQQLGGFNAPQGVYVSPRTGEIWVADTRASRVVRFKRFDRLILDANPDYTEPASAPLGVTQDQFGDLFVLDGLNRVMEFYNGFNAANSANNSDVRPLSPGMISSLYQISQSVPFASSTQAAGPAPLPTTLADTQVLIDDKPVPLYYVSSSQINFLVPMGIGTSGNKEVQVYRPSLGQIVGSFVFPVSPFSPGLFTTTPDGQIAAINQDGTINSIANQLPRGSVITLYGTGAGFVTNAPPDGVAATGAINADSKPRIIIGTDFVPDENILYWGLAPGFPGLWQINVKVPELTAPSTKVPVAVGQASVFSNQGAGGNRILTTIAVKQ